MVFRFNIRTNYVECSVRDDDMVSTTSRDATKIFGNPEVFFYGLLWPPSLTYMLESNRNNELK